MATCTMYGFVPLLAAFYKLYASFMNLC